MRFKAINILRRRCAQRPALTFGFVAAVIVAAVYFTLWRVFLRNDGRWYWNWLATFHPALVHLVPAGSWGPIENPPRFVPEIYDAPWMGTWKLPELSKPVRRHDTIKTTLENPPPSLLSPAIVKLHVFSTVWPKAQAKRRLIREISPIYQIPCQYRHLIEVKFVLGHAYKANWDVDEEIEASLKEEQDKYGDLVRLNVTHGENLREGKILDWMRAAGSGSDGGRPAWWLFKVDDDSVLNLPNFLDTLLSLNPHQPYYLGTSLARWPAYHYHFTGLVTGFNWGLLQTLSDGIGRMTRKEIEAWWDDDVMTGEIMFHLPSAPHCHPPVHHAPDSSKDHHYTLPDYCDPRRPPPWGYLAPPTNPDPRTGLNRYDFVRHMGNEDVNFIQGDIARHGGKFKSVEGYRQEWEANIKGLTWKAPRWLEQYADNEATCNA